MDLNLYRFVDDVMGIVDRAEKELKMEDFLRNMERIWNGLELQFRPHSSGVPLVSPSEELLESLQDHQVRDGVLQRVDVF
jgi:hypothetical protein